MALENPRWGYTPIQGALSHRLSLCLEEPPFPECRNYLEACDLRDLNAPIEPTPPVPPMIRSAAPRCPAVVSILMRSKYASHAVIAVSGNAPALREVHPPLQHYDTLVNEMELAAGAGSHNVACIVDLVARLNIASPPARPLRPFEPPQPNTRGCPSTLLLAARCRYLPSSPEPPPRAPRCRVRSAPGELSYPCSCVRRFPVVVGRRANAVLARQLCDRQPASPSLRIATICDSVNRDFFIGLPSSLKSWVRANSTKRR
jgi:hypothetical protein